MRNREIYKSDLIETWYFYWIFILVVIRLRHTRYNFGTDKTVKINKNLKYSIMYKYI